MLKKNEEKSYLKNTLFIKQIENKKIFYADIKRDCFSSIVQ